jgi:hypothetical protein
MLERGYSPEAIESLFDQLGCRIVLPEDPNVYFAAKGPQISSFSDQRQFPRYNYRQRALVVHRESVFVVYTKDISHSSIGFLHCRQLFPLERVRLCLANGLNFDLTIRRCVRTQVDCYSCGGHIDPECRLTTEQLRELVI